MLDKLDQLVEALLILQPLYGKDIYSFHDGKIFVGDYEPERLTPEQLKRLAELGWEEDEESWALAI